jgi:YrbI family 3-deoxy-D-manno-octulosonate 8-phosphate phosphatase
MKKIRNDNIKKYAKICAKIKIILTDVDGVLTDGGMYYSDKGEIMKKFNTRDGMAIELLKHDIKTIFVSKEKSKIAIKRASKIKASDVFIGVTKKESLLPRICKKYTVNPGEIAYIGDDVNDLEIMKLVGFSATPNDGVDKVKSIADYVCEKKGGDGAFRELADLIISSRIL